MQILLFNLATDVDDPILGFATRWICELAERVDFIHVITMHAGRVQVPDNVHVYSVGKERNYSEPRRVVEFYRHLFRILRNTRIDVTFSHMIPMFTVLAAPVLKAKGIPIITWYAHRQLTTTLKLAHHVSDRMISSHATSYPYRGDKLVTLGHGIDVELFSPDSREPVDPPLLLFVGRLSPIKSPMTLIDAVYLLRRWGHNVHCTLVGDAPARDRPYVHTILQKTQELGLEGTIQFMNGIPNDQVVRWYRRCFVHVNCSPPDNALDKVVLESMACAKPSMTSTLGFKELMGKWSDILLFNHVDPDDLARKICRLLQMNETQRQCLGNTLRQSVVQRHNLPKFIDKLLALLENTRNGHHRDPYLA